MAEDVNKMFSRIHRRYDMMNHLLSLDFDKGWRKAAATEALMPQEEYSVLDVATGTGDLAIDVDRTARKNGKRIAVLGTDFNEDMISIAKAKARRLGLDNIRFETSSAFSMPSKDGSFEVVTSAFGLRSFEFPGEGSSGLHAFLSESYRVLKKGGKAVLLDMAAPDSGIQRSFFHAYSRLMRAMGILVDRSAYNWLTDTISRFDKKKLTAQMEQVGFRNVRIRSLRSGIAFIATGEK